MKKRLIKQILSEVQDIREMLMPKDNDGVDFVGDLITPDHMQKPRRENYKVQYIGKEKYGVFHTSTPAKVIFSSECESECEAWIENQLKSKQKLCPECGNYKRLRCVCDEKPKWPESIHELPRGIERGTVIVDIKALGAFMAISRLYELRQAYRQGWKPDWKNSSHIKYCIEFYVDKPIVSPHYHEQQFLSFETETQAEHFLKHHIDLINQARELI